MDPASWQKAKDVIAEALKQPPSEREAFVRRRCPDLGLAAEVITMLVAYAEAEVPDQPPADPLHANDDPDRLVPGTHVGPYIILDTLGRSGMGQVFLGSDPRLRRKVALKLRHRFAQRQRGATLAHPARGSRRRTHHPPERRDDPRRPGARRSRVHRHGVRGG